MNGKVLAMLDELRAKVAAEDGKGGFDVDARLHEVGKTIASRRRRERVFDSRLFADPAWDILLGLYQDHLFKKPSYVKDACIVSNVPATTALRWLVTLEAEGLVERVGSQTDQRRVALRLTKVGNEGMDRYFDGS